MADVHKLAIRSYSMNKIKGKNTKPELLVWKFLHFYGFRYRKYNKNLQGKPDLVQKMYNTIIFINGCFWHAYDAYYIIGQKED